MEIDLETFALGIELTVGYLERGIKKFADFAKVMIKEVRDVYRPYLKTFYNAVRESPEAQDTGLADEMTPYDDVLAFDVMNFDKKESVSLQTHNIIKTHNITTMEENINEKPQITIEDIIAVFKNYSDVKRMSEIKNAVVAKFTPTDQLICPNEDYIISEVDRLIKEDKKRGNESFLTYNNGKYRKRRNKATPPPPNPEPSTEYIGTAGECAVLSELMFKGYNANRMMIDEGVDIVAVKKNIYYYIQVKTTTIKPNGTITCQIGKDRYDEFVGAQIRYFIVVRYREHNINRNMYFKFSPGELENAIYNRCVKRGDTAISIKIKFDPKTGEPILYDEKEMPAGYFMNNFNL